MEKIKTINNPSSLKPEAIITKNYFKIDDNCYLKVNELFFGNETTTIPPEYIGIKGLLLNISNRTLQYNIFILPKNIFKNNIINKQEFKNLVTKTLHLNDK